MLTSFLDNFCNFRSTNTSYFAVSEIHSELSLFKWFSKVFECFKVLFMLVKQQMKNLFMHSYINDSCHGYVVRDLAWITLSVRIMIDIVYLRLILYKGVLSCLIIFSQCLFSFSHSNNWHFRREPLAIMIHSEEYLSVQILEIYFAQFHLGRGRIYREEN